MTGKIKIVFFTVFMFSILSGLSVQALNYSIELSSDFVSINRRFQLNILVDREEHEDLEITEPEYNEDIVKVSGPYISTVKEKEDDPQYKPKTKITYTYYAARTGRLGIGPYKLDFNGEVIETKPLLLKSGYYRKGRLEVPLKFRWEYENDNPYVGETIKIKLKSFEMEEVEFFYNVNIKNPGNGVFEQIQDADEIISETVGDIELYTLPVVAYAITPSRSGTINIPAVTIRSGGNYGTTDPLRLYVRALPSKVSRTSGAIGAFNYSAEIDADNIEEGEKIDFRIRVDGTGNFNYLQIPDPEFKNLVLLDKTATDNFDEYDNNFTGSLVYDFQFLASEEGPAVIKTQDFLFFDKDKKEVVTIEGSKYDINILPALGQKKEKNPLPESLEALIDFNKLLKMNGIQLYANLFLYLSLLPGILFFFIVLIKKKKAARSIILLIFFISCSFSIQKELKLESGKYEQAIKHFENSEYEKAALLISEISEKYPSNYGLHINKAVLNIKMGRTAEAVAQFRKAILITPMSFRLRNELGMLEAHLGLKNQLKPGFIVDPDVFFIASIILFNFFFIIWAFILKNKSAKKYIVLIFALGLLSVSVFFNLYSVISNNKKECIILENTSIKKIPKEAASLWIEFNKGEVFRIIDEYGEYYLIENAYKIRGWLEKNRVLLTKDA